MFSQAVSAGRLDHGFLVAVRKLVFLMAKLGPSLFSDRFSDVFDVVGHLLGHQYMQQLYLLDQRWTLCDAQRGYS